MNLHAERFGDGGPTLLLLHGIAGNGAVWGPLLKSLDGRWPGKILVPDLRGHGRTPHASHYSFGQYASDIADLLYTDEQVWVVGHSMGQVVGLALASGWYGLSVGAVLGFGMKVRWNDTDMEKRRSLANVPVRWFETRTEAAQRFMRLSGVADLVSEDDQSVEAGLRQEKGLWRVAADARIYDAPTAPYKELVGLAKAPVILACGSKDPMVCVDELRVFDLHAIQLDGLGHNLHLEAPQILADLIQEKLLPLLGT